MIYWDILLDSENVKEGLQSLYDHSQSIHDMAEFLGVSATALRRVMKINGVVIREKHDNIPRKSFPRTDNDLLNKYTIWILRRRGIKMAYRHRKDSGPKVASV